MADKCPLCNHEFDSDDFYEMGFYNNENIDEGEFEAECRHCKDKFMAKVETQLEFHMCSKKAFERWDDVELGDLYGED